MTFLVCDGLVLSEKNLFKLHYLFFGASKPFLAQREQSLKVGEVRIHLIVCLWVQLKH